ncbi:hypothetical protein [Streptomyces cremeus]|uniref:Uncharacterized protein n=1 Tax=Streptomyces cremeus TaxID=66881 RepID=A0ABV5PDS8_STRCM
MIPPTVIVGLHGRLVRHPWFDRVLEGISDETDPDSSLEEDVLGLVIDRAGAYGWQTLSRWLHEDGRTTARHEPTAWAHEEVGGDWTEDGAVRQLAWLQAGFLDAAQTPGSSVRLPVRPMTLVLTEVLERVGEVSFTGLHALLPLQAAQYDTAFFQGELAPWFGLADPDSAYDVAVTVFRVPGGDGGRGATVEQEAAAVCAGLGDLAQGAVTCTTPGTKAASATEGPGAGLALDLDGVLHTTGMREVMRLDCRTREWTPDLAVWLLEAVAEGLRAAGGAVPTVVSVSLVSPSP